MDTSKINFLCSIGDRISDNKKMSENLIIADVTKLKIETNCKTITLSLSDYPELRPLVDKLKDYIIKSADSHLKDIKLDIMRALAE